MTVAAKERSWWRLLRSLLLVASVIVSIAASALSVAMTLSEVAFNAVATAVRVATGRPTLEARPLVRYREGKLPLRGAVADTKRRVSARVTLGAARSVATAAGEAVPGLGVPVVVAATAADLYDACETMKDLNELAAAIDPKEVVDANVVCGIPAPTLEGVWNKIRSSPTIVIEIACDWVQCPWGAPPAQPEASR